MRLAVNPAPAGYKSAAVRMDVSAPGSEPLPATKQPPSGWTCVRPAVNPAPASYETAAVRMDPCAPGFEPSPCRLRNSRPPDGRVCARQRNQPLAATKQPPSGQTCAHAACTHRLPATPLRRLEGRVLYHRERHNQRCPSPHTQRHPQRRTQPAPSRHRRQHHHRSLASATNHPRPTTRASNRHRSHQEVKPPPPPAQPAHTNPTPTTHTEHHTTGHTYRLPTTHAEEPTITPDHTARRPGPVHRTPDAHTPSMQPQPLTPAPPTPGSPHTIHAEHRITSQAPPVNTDCHAHGNSKPTAH